VAQAPAGSARPGSDLVDEINRKKNAHMHDAYIAKYGPRPEEAKWQRNSSPF
jgi:hypothetical protein